MIENFMSRGVDSKMSRPAHIDIESCLVCCSLFSGEKWFEVSFPFHGHGGWPCAQSREDKREHWGPSNNYYIKHKISYLMLVFFPTNQNASFVGKKILTIRKGERWTTFYESVTQPPLVFESWIYFAQFLFKKTFICHREIPKMWYFGTMVGYNTLTRNL